MISKIRIKNFKAIKDSGEIALSPFTAIIGKNGSGKSSLIEGIEFIHDLVTNDLEYALQKWKNYKDILYKGEKIRFDKDEFNLSDKTVTDKYVNDEDEETDEYTEEDLNAYVKNEDSISYEYTEGIYFEITFKIKSYDSIQEYFCLISKSNEDDKIILAAEHSVFKSNYDVTHDRENEYLIESSSHFEERKKIEKISDYKSILSSNQVKEFNLNFHAIQILNLNTFLIGDPSIKYFSREERKLLKDGSNLLNFLFWIKKNDEIKKERRFKDIEDDFKTIIQYSEDLRPEVTSEIQSMVYFQLIETRDKNEIRIPSWLVSTGSQKILALLSIIHNPNPAPLVIIEEFENGLDPWTISYLITKIKEFIEKTGSQVIITTHSPTLLNILKFEEILFAKRDNEKGTLEYVRFEEEKEMFDDIQRNILPGEFYEKIRREEKETLALKKELEKISKQIEGKDKIKCLVFTEDEKKEDTPNGPKYLIEIILEASGFRMDETAFISFNGKDNIRQAIFSSHFIVTADYPNLQKVIFHLDRDVNNDKDKEIYRKLMDDKLKNKGHLFYTKNYDAESYFLSPEHINRIIPLLSLDKIKEFIRRSMDEKEIESFDRFDDTFNEEIREFLTDQKKKSDQNYNKKNIKHSEIRKELERRYEADRERYVYGKEVFQFLCGLIRTETKINAKIKILQSSEFVKDEELEKIAKEVWGESNESGK